ncbi:MAG: hypothetical protein EXS17_00540 [Phycisphaerales bacterium]|nr:hypothetical protein [Phycisphaerales bacterium]
MRFRPISCALLAFAATSSLSAADEPRARPAAPAPKAQLPHVVSLASPLVRSATQSGVAQHLRDAVSAIEIDEQLWKALCDHNDVLVRDVPIGPTRTESFVLHRVDPFAQEPLCVAAHLNDDGSVTERPIALPSIECFVGSLVNKPDSRVLLSRGEGFLAGYVQCDGQTSVISSGRLGTEGPIVSYTMDDLPPGTFAPLAWSCEALLPPNNAGGGGDEGGLAGNQPCRQSRIAVDTDVELLALFNNNPNAALGYIGTLFAAIADIYSRDTNFRPSACYIRLWPDGTDPWTATSTSAQLPEFQGHWESTAPFMNRNSAALLSGRGLGGGIAWLNAGCGIYGYSVSANLGGSFPYPLVDNSGANWDIMVFAHELGHNYGAPHTHSYTPPADGCGSNPQDCAAATADLGTIMSYCHICPGGMANINLHFHAFSVDSISGYLNAATCGFSAVAQPPVAVPDRVTAMSGAVVDIDVLANDLRFNCETTTLASLTQPAQGGSVVIVAGAGPQGRAIARLTPPAGSVANVSFSYLVSEASGDFASAQIDVDFLTFRVPENPTGDSPGVAAAYYVTATQTMLPDFTTLTPYASNSVAQLSYASTGGNFASSGRADDVGAVFTGWISVPTSGAWTFYTNSDDGSRLLIGETVVVLNDGLHGMVENSGVIALGAGKHAIRTEFFERGGGAGLIVSWSGPGIAKSVIPTSAWTKGGVVNRADINRDGIVNSADLAALLSMWNSTTPAGDINQDGLVDAVDLGLLLSKWTP